MRLCFSYLILAGVLCAGVGCARAGEADDPEEAFRKRKEDEQKKVLDAYNTKLKEVEKNMQDLKAAREKAATLLTEEVTIDGEKVQVKEPATPEQALGFTGDRRVRDIYEVTPDDFDIVTRDRWAVNLSDFKIDLPHYVTGQVRAGHDQSWFCFSFSITNSSAKPRRISPVFTAITNKGAINVNTGGFLPERLLANSMNRPLANSNNPQDKELLSQGIVPLESVADMLSGADKAGGALKPTANFEPGQTRWGAALWSSFDNNFTELKIVVSGLTNSHKYDEKLRRVLVLSFERNSDGFNVSRVQLKYKAKKWEYIWMWDQDISVPVPADAKDPQLKASKLKTPAGGERYVMAFPYEIKNSTKTNQNIAIMHVSLALPVEVDVGGTKVLVEVRVVDDGTSNIYKAQLLKELGGEVVKDRFQNKALVDGSKTNAERHTVTMETGKVDKNWAVFDEMDVDWSNAIDQVERTLSRGYNREELAKAYWDKNLKDSKLKNPGNLYDPRRMLNADEVKSVKEQIVKALPDAVEKVRAKKVITAYFDCISGMSTSEQRISRSYRQPGNAEEYWLKAWEEFEKPVAPVP